MDICNRTWFPADDYGILTSEGEELQALVARVSYELEPDGSCRLAEVQTPLAASDAFHGEMNLTSLRTESDLAPFKPRCDLVVLARAHAPGGRPLARWEARVTLVSAAGETLADKRLAVTGPRRLHRKGVPSLGLLNPWTLSEPEPALEVDLRHELAFGGWIRVMASDPAFDRIPPERFLPGVDPLALRKAFLEEGQDELVAQAFWVSNLVGRGYAPLWWLELASPESLPAPQLELPGRPFTAQDFWDAARGKANENDPALGPLAFGLLPKTHPSRVRLAGTYDEAWVQNQHPLPPEDYDMAYWNAAPAELQTDHPAGGEWVEVRNVLPEGSPFARKTPLGDNLFRFQVPPPPLEQIGRTEEGQLGALMPALDTLILDLEDVGKPRLTLLYRTLVSPEFQVESCVLRLTPELLEAHASGRLAAPRIAEEEVEEEEEKEAEEDIDEEEEA